MDKNKFTLIFDANSANESFSRNVVASFCLQLNPTIDWLGDVKTAVSEAVTNCIVHAYDEKGGQIVLDVFICDNVLDVVVKDFGAGISDIDQALEPFYTTKGETERSGMGFTVMQTFMDSFDIKSTPNQGTTVHMTKKIMCGGKDA